MFSDGGVSSKNDLRKIVLKKEKEGFIIIGVALNEGTHIEMQKIFKPQRIVSAFNNDLPENICKMIKSLVKRG